MERTFNVFVDNGLFIASHYLKKEIENITIDDLKNNIHLFVNKIDDFINVKKFEKITDMGFHNSCYTQKPKKITQELEKYKKLFDVNNLQYDYDTKKQEIKLTNKKESIFYTYNLILDNIGNDECCSICGKKYIKLQANHQYLSMLTNAVMPMLTANTFFNYSNNLQLINVCPVCVFLSMLSILNMRKSGYIILYNSEENDFMYNLTNIRQNEFRNEIQIDNNNFDKQGNTIEMQKEILSFIDEKINNNNLKVYKVNNGGQNSYFEENFLAKQDLDLFYQVFIEDLLHEFNENCLFYNLLKGNLKGVYLNKLIDYKKLELKCSKQLIMLLDRRLNKLEKNLNELIQNMCKKINEENSKDCLTQLKNVSSSYKFAELILKWQEQYKEKIGKNLLETQEEYDLIMDRRKYIDIKNKIMFELILNK